MVYAFKSNQFSIRRNFAMVRRFFGLAGAIAFGTISLLSALPAQALTFKPPGNAAPTQSTGGASRDGGQCLSNATQAGEGFISLMPTANIGLTRQDRPTFMAYVPQNSAQKAFFSLQSQDGNYYYQASIALPDKGGVISIALPSDAPALEIGKNYQWNLAIVCGENLQPDSPSVAGWVQRVQAGGTEPAVTLESAEQLANAGIWYDTLSTLAALRRAEPNNVALAQNWEALLGSAGLEAIAAEPLVE
jgi:hypothetical protein